MSVNVAASMYRLTTMRLSPSRVGQCNGGLTKVWQAAPLTLSGAQGLTPAGTLANWRHIGGSECDQGVGLKTSGDL
jgi:hypothetical protein